jgi:hypothetical protein
MSRQAHPAIPQLTRPPGHPASIFHDPSTAFRARYVPDRPEAPRPDGRLLPFRSSGPARPAVSVNGPGAVTEAHPHCPARRARCVPDRVVAQGPSRSLADKSQHRPPGLMQVIARAVSAFRPGTAPSPRAARRASGFANETRRDGADSSRPGRQPPVLGSGQETHRNLGDQKDVCRSARNPATAGPLHGVPVTCPIERVDAGTHGHGQGGYTG